VTTCHIRFIKVSNIDSVKTVWWNFNENIQWNSQRKSKSEKMSWICRCGYRNHITTWQNYMVRLSDTDQPQSTRRRLRLAAGVRTHTVSLCHVDDVGLCYACITSLASQQTVLRAYLYRAAWLNVKAVGVNSADVGQSLQMASILRTFSSTLHANSKCLLSK